MLETTRPTQEQAGGPSGLGSLFAGPGDVPALVTVSSGPYLEQLPVGGASVGEIRRRFRDRLDLDPQSQAVLDGQTVGDDVTVRPGQALMFTRRAGEKGVRPWTSSRS
jgi:hypothetical protein